MRFVKTTLCVACIVLPAAVSAADKNETIDRFLAQCKANPQLNDQMREEIVQAVEKLRQDPATMDEAITAGLRIASPEFAAALQSLGAEQAEQAVNQLSPLATSPDPFLLVESKLFLARALVLQERHEDALPHLTAVTEVHAADTVRAGEARFLKAQAEVATLDMEAARDDFLQFLNENPNAPRRARREAQAALIDIEEADTSMLPDIHTKMDFSRRRLTLEDTGEKTQAVQEEVVALLTQMIEELEKKCGNCKGCKSCCGGSKPGGGGMGGANPGMSSGTSQEPRLTERDGPRTPWVDLSQRHEDPTAFNAAKTRYPLQYKELVEQYYRSFQEQKDQ
jgi:tetratricopeptide (TPR) repeat protein